MSKVVIIEKEVESCYDCPNMIQRKVQIDESTSQYVFRCNRTCTDIEDVTLINADCPLEDY